MTPTREQVEAVVEDIVRKRFPDGRIARVVIEKDAEDEGADVLRVHVVLSRGNVDAERASGLIRHMRTKLAEIGDNSFPLLSFLSQSDARGLKPEAA